MSSLVGKTVVADDGDRIVFSDGTSISGGDDYDEYGFYRHDYAETLASAHREQGYRERRRMQRLHDMLHPRDKQWLRNQALKAEEKRNASLGGFDRILEKCFVDEIRRDFNRASFFSDWAELLPRQKRKHRRPPTYEAGKTYRRKDGSLFFCHGTIDIPIHRHGSRPTGSL